MPDIVQTFLHSCDAWKLHPQSITAEYTLTQAVEDRYWVSRYAELGWQVVEESNDIKLRKNSSCYYLTGHVFFIPSPDNHSQIDFGSWLETSSGISFQHQYRSNPGFLEVEQILVGVYEAYLEGETNNSEILQCIERYRKL